MRPPVGTDSPTGLRRRCLRPNWVLDSSPDKVAARLYHYGEGMPRNRPDYPPLAAVHGRTKAYSSDEPRLYEMGYEPSR